MQALQSLPPIVALVLGLVLLAWLVLVFLVPFMIESIRQSTRKTHEQLAELNSRIEQLNATLLRNPPSLDRAYRSDPRPGAEPPARGRREPTISEMDFKQPQHRERREPVVK